MPMRSAFFAVEGLFRSIFPSAHQLSSGEIQKPAINLAQKLVASVKTGLTARTSTDMNPAIRNRRSLLSNWQFMVSALFTTMARNGNAAGRAGDKEVGAPLA
ncbi:hypothetical protein RLEG12_18510 [Rhizobium leguminosarum bv. trifolii CB782]|nr:hypothetical protein RLEG12_18510 [Rhizobium leguminosarum bv. trifolii CB782]